ncbi:MAG: SDR family oxidoreductase [Planctomycetaceae bacterium]|nr:MAG: SDR family oxidoreductase [Planctomycetaceae bacterium]
MICRLAISIRGHCVKKALITGINGQDGSYLTELLLEQGYDVHGLVRRVALEDPSHRLGRLRGVIDRVRLHSTSMESFASIFGAIEAIRPDECYHLAAQSFVSYSLDDEFSTMTTNVNGTHYLLSALKQNAPECRFYFAGSSEMFGHCSVSPQDEDTPFHPRSAYGISKVAGFHLTRNYRNTYGMFGCNGILFNHESPRRGYEFVTRKITSAAAKIKLGMEKTLRLGNLDARRDWGFAPDYVRAMWLMLQQDKPDDFVIGTGKTHSVREFVERAFDAAGLKWQDHVVLDEAFFRPSETHPLCGNAAKAQKMLGWSPTVDFERIVEMMVLADMEHFSQRKEE